MAAGFALSWEASAHRMTPAVKAKNTPPARNNTANKFSPVNLINATPQSDQISHHDPEGSSQTIVRHALWYFDSQMCCLCLIEVPKGRGMIL
jgi:hypothetical protein